MEDEAEIQAFLDGLADKTVKLRKGLGLTQLDLSVRTGLDVRHIQRVEAGEAHLSIVNLIRIANAFELSVSQYLNLEES